MNEYFLHFVWQYQFFNKQDLLSSEKEKIEIIHPGHHNSDQGPDFIHARLLIDGIEWHGNVEIHQKASDWYQHKHQHDLNYDNVILHIVWEDDCLIKRKDQSTMSLLSLKNRVEPALIDKYRTFVNSGINLPCQYYLHEIPPAYITAMFDKVLVERLERKGKEVLQCYEENNNDWEATFWQLLMCNFGFKINNEAFTQLSHAVPYKLLLKHSDNLLQLEALLFGQAGLLDNSYGDEYYILLKNEYKFLSHKYSLEGKKMSPHIWKFLRTRPYNFPTIRIAQFAALVSESDKLINLVFDRKTSKEYVSLLKTMVSPYWQQHYKFGQKVKGGMPGISESTAHSLIINVIIPFKTARHLAGMNEHFPEDQFDLLEQLPAEKNKVSGNWETAKLKMNTAYDSQSGIELYNQYCLRRKCLYCSIGTHIIKKE